MPADLSRREFASAALLGLTRKSPRAIAGGFVDNSHLIGHRIRDKGRFPAPRLSETFPVVIVGGGVAGLSAAWQLARSGLKDFVVLELEQHAGGNCRWGENEVSRYPWAAHYVPPPARNAPLTRELFTELGLLRNGEWDERHLCHSPQERLFLHGRWQEGLEPDVGVGTEARREIQQFLNRMAEFRASGEFTVPAPESIGKRFAPLDQASMTAWLTDNGFKSPSLHWYADYTCRDDYGTSAGETSAWAGIHYHAARDAGHDAPLTWPEGNGWIIERLLGRFGSHVRTGSPVYRIERSGTRLRVYTETTVYTASTVIFAASTSLASRIVEGAPPAQGFSYAPWLTANLTLDRWPKDRQGAEQAWDNVIYGSSSLGYVVATHQTLASQTPRTVWTYYWALTHTTPAAARRELLERDWKWWVERILADLERAHSDIRECVSRVDLMRHGHAMIRPVPGFMTSSERRRWSKPDTRVFYANSDLSGYSVFEEAQHRGVAAAQRVLRVL